VVDGVTLVDTPENALRSGAAQDIPLLVGSTTNEGAAMIAALEFGAGRIPTESSYRAFIEKLFGDLADEILEQYPVGNYPSPADAESAVETDSQFACPSLWTAEAAGQGGASSIWKYQFAEAPLPPNPVISGAFHAADVPYIFSSLLGIPIPWTGPSLAFAHQLQAQWATFAHTGSPNAEGLPLWPEWNPESPSVLQTSAASSFTKSDFAAEHKCDFWFGL
jgi:para-nitrobenzyl esterase